LTTNIAFRDAVQSDSDFLHEVYYSTRQNEMDLMGWGADDAGPFLKMQFDFQDRHYRSMFPDACRLIIMMDGEKAGRIIIERNDGFIRIVLLEFLPEFQKKGCGSFILKCFQAEAAGRNISVCFNVAVDNVRGQKLFKSLGFYETGTDDAYYFMEWKKVKDFEVNFQNSFLHNGYSIRSGEGLRIN